VCAVFVSSRLVAHRSFESSSQPEYMWTAITTFHQSSHQARWPSGLRRQLQVLVSQDAWVRIPLLSYFFLPFRTAKTIFLLWEHPGLLFAQADHRWNLHTGQIVLSLDINSCRQTFLSFFAFAGTLPFVFSWGGRSKATTVSLTYTN
jgi:hypothetical protein